MINHVTWSDNSAEEWLNSVLERITAGVLLPAQYFASLDCDAVLEARDMDVEFEAMWSQLFGQVNDLWAALETSPRVRSLVEDIRRQSFLAVSRATARHEIASYVSDDFDLIVRGRLARVASPLLGKLWNSYEHGRFPTPPL